MISLKAFAAHLEQSIMVVPFRIGSALGLVGSFTQKMAVEYIGHEIPQWPRLAASTIVEKTRLGYVGHVSETDPLLRKGDNRASIQTAVEGYEMAVGSTRKEFLWQEIGTIHIPPRPALAVAALNALPFAEKAFGDVAVALLTPPGALR
jgi:hypothetical protein